MRGQGPVPDERGLHARGRVWKVGECVGVWVRAEVRHSGHWGGGGVLPVLRETFSPFSSVEDNVLWGSLSFSLIMSG